MTRSGLFWSEGEGTFSSKWQVSFRGNPAPPLAREREGKVYDDCDCDFIATLAMVARTIRVI